PRALLRTARLPAVAPPRPAHRPAPDDQLVRLGEALLRVYPFETRRWGETRRCPPRTVGCTGLLLSGGDGPDVAGAPEAVAVCRRSPEAPRSGEAARDKVVFCGRGGETAVYQADRQKRSAALCACGNATGASAAMLAHCLHRRQVRQELTLPDG